MYQPQKCTECGHYLIVSATRNTMTCANRKGECPNAGRSYRVSKQRKDS